MTSTGGSVSAIRKRNKSTPSNSGVAPPAAVTTLAEQLTEYHSPVVPAGNPPIGESRNIPRMGSVVDATVDSTVICVASVAAIVRTALVDSVTMKHSPFPGATGPRNVTEMTTSDGLFSELLRGEVSITPNSGVVVPEVVGEVVVRVVEGVEVADVVAVVVGDRVILVEGVVVVVTVVEAELVPEVDGVVVVVRVVVSVEVSVVV